MFLIYDTETTGLPRDFNAPITNSENWPRLVQLAWQIHDAKGNLLEVKNFIVKPEGFDIPFNAEKVHGISTERALKEGVDLGFVLEEFNKDLDKDPFIIGHNIVFDVNIMGAEYYRKQVGTKLMDLKTIDTKDEATDYCAIPGGRGGKFKWPSLTELHTKLFQEGFSEAHNASADVEATTRCFLELVRIGVVNANRLGVDEDFVRSFRENNPNRIELIGLNIEPYKALDTVAEEDSTVSEEIEKDTSVGVSTAIGEASFTHLHNHSQFSVLQSTSGVKALVKKAKELGMPAVALTDHGNMFGAFIFVKEALANDIKPIVGCEFNLARDRTDKKSKDNGFQQVLLAKHKQGYHNLAKLCSISYMEGFYYVPRIDREILKDYKEGLIATTGGLFSEIPYLILNEGEKNAEEAFLWWKDQFGGDFYIELLRHGLEEEVVVNKTLLKFAEAHGVKYFAANNTYYLDKDGATPHDALLCVKDGEQQSRPKKYIGRRGREFRFGFPNDQFYFKSPKEMKELFADLPEAIITTSEIQEKIESYKLQRDVLLPEFDIQDEFKDPKDLEDGGKRGENNYLKHLTYEGAKKRYGEVTPEIKERLDFELSVIANTGYPGYFLIVQDFTSQARKMGVSVGPGRGSAAGSAVAYCIGITNVDPIKYDLLFERFLNPDRVSLPDIDIDFDDEGRGRIIDWVVNKYGQRQVAQIITYGTMAAKSSIRDTARVMELPLPDADRIAKLIPDISLAKLFGWDEKQLETKLNPDQMEQARELRKIASGKDLMAETIQQAIVLEGSVRNTGTHACGVIITPDDITKYVPVTAAKDSDLLVTQYDNSVVESAGMLKMDFLGLKTLTIIKDAISIIKQRHGVEIDPDEIPLDDVKTYELYQRGETNGTFQFESAGMQKYLRQLKPDKFGDLIAMNALYRPGPLEYIPNFVARKLGEEEITYDLPDMEEYLAETYGITVYQEQVMLLSQKLAGFTKGEADMLRKAMGKKILALLEQLKPKFINGGKEKGHDPKKLEKIWKDWEAFAAYAFNKSHSTCYSVVAFHTAYLKANYPAEYMASVLANNMNDIKKVTFFMEECKRAGIEVLGPDVNESVYKFIVNNKGQIRFGLGAIKGVGEGAVHSIINERKENGLYTSVFDLARRIDLRAANKRVFESLVHGGAFDSFENAHRAQFFHREGDSSPFIEKIIKYGNNYQESKNSSQVSLFDVQSDMEIVELPMPQCEEWGTLEKLSKEKEVVGIFISGHPLDNFKLEIANFCNASVSELNDLEKIKGREIRIAGIASSVAHRISKNGNPFGILELEDYNDSFKFFIFGDDYVKFKDFLREGWFLYLEGKVQPRRFDKTQFEFSISKMELLPHLMEKVARKISFDLEISQVTDSFVEELSEHVASGEGVCQLRMNITDLKKKMMVELYSSSSFGVKLTPDFMNWIQTKEGYRFKIAR